MVDPSSSFLPWFFPYWVFHVYLVFMCACILVVNVIALKVKFDLHSRNLKF